MQIVFYKFTKRPNSTKQPAADDSTRFVFTGARLKENCSFVNPVLLIPPELTSGGVTVTFSPVMYNYCWVTTWQRYYYIQDWTYLNSVWECRLIPDPLASFRTEIGSTSAYVLRSSYTFDTDIIDTFYPAKSNVEITKVNVACTYYNKSPSGGTYVLGCINYDTVGKFGAISYYALTQSLFNTVMRYLFESNIYYASDIDEIGEGLFKSMFNPFQYIVSCIWFPFPIETFGSTASTVKVGYWEIAGTSAAVLVTNQAQTTYVTATIPNHDQISRGAYLNRAPYTRITLFIPPFGAIPIDTNFLTIGRYLYSEVIVDHITGQATLRLSICKNASNLDKYNVITERSGMLGIPIQLAQIMPDYMGTAQAITSGLSSAFSGNIGGLVNSALSAIETQQPKVSISGANGSFISELQYPVLIVENLLLADEDLQEFGRPLHQVTQISAIPGFIVCGEDDHSFSGTSEENRIINEHMKNGFFYE